MVKHIRILEMFQHSNVMAEMMGKEEITAYQFNVLQQTTISPQCILQNEIFNINSAGLHGTHKHALHVHVQSDVTMQFWNQKLHRFVHSPTMQQPLCILSQW